MDEHMSDLPERQRERVLKKARSEVLGAVPSPDGAIPDDEDIEHALRTVGPAAHHAHRLVEALEQDGARGTQSEEERRWLGVCAAIGEQTGMPPTQVRLGALALGLLTGPFALVIYIGLFFVQRASGRSAVSPIEKWVLTKYVLGLILGAVALRYVAWGFVALLNYGYGLLFKEALVLSGLWNWLQRYDGALFFWTLFILTPLAVLAGLPVPTPWRNTLRKVFEAGLALYAAALCFGAGCAVAGTILNAAQRMQTSPIIDFQAMFSAM
jgi:phage shock protein PspC (stress-responsive transcriptional regulator)